MANKLTILASVVAASTAMMATSAQAADTTLDKVTKQGFLTCGVSTGLPGFSNPNSKGEWEGIDVEYCQALAAAVLGDKTKVKYVPLTAKERFTALQSGEIDVLSRNTTWTLHRDTALGLNFVGVTLTTMTVKVSWSRKILAFLALKSLMVRQFAYSQVQQPNSI